MAHIKLGPVYDDVDYGSNILGKYLSATDTACHYFIDVDSHELKKTVWQVGRYQMTWVIWFAILNNEQLVAKGRFEKTGKKVNWPKLGNQFTLTQLLLGWPLSRPEHLCALNVTVGRHALQRWKKWANERLVNHTLSWRHLRKTGGNVLMDHGTHFDEPAQNLISDTISSNCNFPQFLMNALAHMLCRPGKIPQFRKVKNCPGCNRGSTFLVIQGNCLVARSSLKWVQTLAR